jgi:hypothetical protein
VWSAIGEQDASGPHCAADFMVGCWRSADPGALCVRLPIFGRVCWRSGIEHQRRAGESWLAAVPGPESCGTSRDGQSEYLEFDAPGGKNFAPRRLFVSNAKGIVVIAPKLCQEGNVGRSSKMVFADVIV